MENFPDWYGNRWHQFIAITTEIMAAGVETIPRTPWTINFQQDTFALIAMLTFYAEKNCSR